MDQWQGTRADGALMDNHRDCLCLPLSDGNGKGLRCPAVSYSRSHIACATLSHQTSHNVRSQLRRIHIPIKVDA